MSQRREDTEDSEARQSDEVEGFRLTEHDATEALTPNSPLPDTSKTEVSVPLINPTTGTVLSAATYCLEDSAFATWCEQLNVTVHEHSSALQDQVQELQQAFEDASQYIRGDFAWRKQVVAFHDRTNDVVTSVLQEFKDRFQQSTQSLSVSLDETLKVKDALAKEEMQRLTRMYEDKLRRARTSLKKEIERFTHLEKCLRKEETHQATAMYDRLVHQLTMEYAAKEATLQASLRELKVSYTTIENANTELMDTIKVKDDEIERLKKLLPKTNGSGMRSNTAARPGSGTASVVALAASDAYAQSLRQSLQSANTTIEGLRKQAEDASADKEAIVKKQRQTEETVAKLSDELIKVKHLLTESHSALLANRKEVETLLQEKTHWKDLYTELHFQSSSHERALDDTKRLAEVAQSRVESLERAVHWKRGAIDSSLLVELREQWKRWQEGSDETHRLPATVWTLMESLISPSGMPNDLDHDITNPENELEIKLRLEFERKYGDMLNVRISHERKRVLTRIEMIWNKRTEDAVSNVSSAMKAKQFAPKDTRRPPQKPTKGSEPTRGASLKQILQLVTEAFNDLGFCDWASTDIDMLHDELTSLRGTLRSLQTTYEKLQQYTEGQALSIAKTELHLREKEILLAELNDRFRVLRIHTEKLQAAQKSGEQAPPPMDLSQWDSGDPFTVYGRQQVIEEKQRVARTRPVSASATLIHCHSTTDKTTPSFSPSEPQFSTRANHRLSTPKTFLLSQLPDLCGGNCSVPLSNKALQQREDHVRSVLKADLLSLTPGENQLEDGSHVGADGIFQIMQRRRHRK